MLVKNPEDTVFIDKEILDAVVHIAKQDIDNILFLFSIHSYKNDPNFQNSRQALSTHIHKNMQDIKFKQRVNNQDLKSTSAFENISIDLQNTNTNPEDDNEYKRLILSVFTTSRAELDEIAIKCLSLENVSVYII